MLRDDLDVPLVRMSTVFFSFDSIPQEEVVAVESLSLYEDLAVAQRATGWPWPESTTVDMPSFSEGTGNVFTG